MPFLLLLLRIQRHVARLLLDHPHHFLLGAGVEDKAALPQKQLHLLRDVTARHVDPLDAARHGEAFVDGYRVGDAVAGVHDDARRPARGVEREHRLDRRE